MARLTARQLRQRENEVFSIDIGNGDEVLVRRPDMQLLVLQGTMPMAIFGEVLNLFSDWAGKTKLADIPETVIQESDKLLTFVNMFVCEALVDPKVVQTQAEQTTEDILLVSELTMQTKKAIILGVTNHVQAINQEVVAAAKEFPEGGLREGVGSDVPALQPATV